MEKRLETKQMKLTKQTLKQIIKEELSKLLVEDDGGFYGKIMRGIMTYQPELPKQGIEPYIPESISYDIEGQKGKITGRQAQVISIMSFQDAKESGDQEAMERHAENAKNAWSMELNMKGDPEKQESFKLGLMDGSIDFKVDQEIFRYRRSKKR